MSMQVISADLDAELMLKSVLSPINLKATLHQYAKIGKTEQLRLISEDTNTNVNATNHYNTTLLA
ncbi:MAG: hypothetical protein NWF01_11015 [Candidatus Bathyarchaeota archaeon]|nr:hypothetical protein [Candidatus Bathyarchaeota archaeon]